MLREQATSPPQPPHFPRAYTPPISPSSLGRQEATIERLRARLIRVEMALARAGRQGGS